MSMNEADTRYHLIDPVLRTKGYPLAHRHVRDDVVDQVRRRLGHAPGPT